ncbi:hypothetical protein Taro_022210 [Colocasia esculenta]|uniref:RING-CH-type domain-containing protein n=1 Tax=Colocasia esculenta TaxID=4460 RepID=A0A843V789_COLES|nr:hypothetical protein [Colocasia esculenta]
MGDHFVLLVDRLLTESTLEATIESRSQSLPANTAVAIVQYEPGCSPKKTDLEDGVHSLKIVECRICQDEDLDSNMETPCSCCGSLKYAHRTCVQRWCNEKGDTMCEICLQQFKPGYTAPPQLFHYGAIPMNFRGNWEISRHDPHSPRFISMVPTGPSFVNADYDDYSTSNERSIFYCRIVAGTLLVLLLLSHTLPVIISFGEGQYSLAELLLILLRTAAVLLPVYVMAQALAVLHRRHHRFREADEFPVGTSEGLA